MRRGKIPQWSMENLKTKSSNSTTMFRNIYRERFQIIWGEILQWFTKNLITNSSNLIFLNEPGLMRRQNSVMKRKE